MKRTRPLRAVAVAVALALPMVLWAPTAFVTDAPTTKDPTPAQAADAAVARAIRTDGPAGAARDWSDRPGFGTPVIAERRVGAFNPLDPARALVPPERSAPWRAAFVLLVAGWTTYRLLRLLGLFRTTALFGALAFAMHGAFATAAYEPWVRAAALAPALWWMVERLLRRPEASRAATAAFAFALIALADEPACGIAIAMSGFLWALVRIATATEALGGRRRTARAAAWLVGAAGLGAAIAWPQIGASLHAPIDPLGAPRDARAWLACLAPQALGGGSYPGMTVLVAATLAILASFGRDRRVTALVLVGIAGAAVATTTGWTHGATTVVALAVASLAALGLQRCWPLFGPPMVDGRRLAIAASIPLALLAVAIARFVADHADVAIAALWTDGGLAPLVGYASGGAACAFAVLVACRRVRVPWSGVAWRLAPLVVLLAELGLHGALAPPARPSVAAPGPPPRALLVDATGTTACPSRVDAPGSVRVDLPARERPAVLVLATTAGPGWHVVGAAARPRRDGNPTFVRAEIAPGAATTVVARHEAASLRPRLTLAVFALAAAMLLWSLGLRSGRGGATLPEPRPYLWIAAAPSSAASTVEPEREECRCD